MDASFWLGSHGYMREELAPMGRSCRNRLAMNTEQVS